MVNQSYHLDLKKKMTVCQTKYIGGIHHQSSDWGLGREGCCTYSLSLMHRLNQTETFRGITLFPDFYTLQQQVSSAVWQL
jgi:hypothetical protein